MTARCRHVECQLCWALQGLCSHEALTQHSMLGQGRDQNPHAFDEKTDSEKLTKFPKSTRLES